MSSKVPASRRSAFTLVEVMMAAAILAAGLIGMIQAVASGSEMLDVARKQTIAAQIINGQIEYIRLLSWSEVGNLDPNHTASVDASDQSANIAKGFVFGTNLPAISQGFTCKRLITTVKTDLKQVAYTVSWTGLTGRSYSRNGSTYVGKNGLYVTYQRS